MLVLTRKVGESIRVGGDITITVVDAGGGKVKIGIDAPRSVTVDRAEVAASRAAGGPPPARVGG